jgi:hypothetical protein
MAQNWYELTGMTGSRVFDVERVRMRDNGVVVEGEFELPPLARLPYEDQVFVAAFVRSHGSIKEMEALFGISYPTVKGRLKRIAEQLDFVKVKPVDNREQVLAQLERGEITVDQAAERLKK